MWNTHPSLSQKCSQVWFVTRFPLHECCFLLGGGGETCRGRWREFRVCVLIDPNTSTTRQPLPLPSYPPKMPAQTHPKRTAISCAITSARERSPAKSVGVAKVRQGFSICRWLVVCCGVKIGRGGRSDKPYHTTHIEETRQTDVHNIHIYIHMSYAPRRRGRRGAGRGCRSASRRSRSR